MKNNKVLFILIGIMIVISYRSTSIGNDLTNKTEAALSSKINLAETVYKLGYQLFTEKRYADADMVLRYWLFAMVPNEIGWKEKAAEILTSDEFYKYYSTVRSTNLLWLSTIIPDELLFDKESVKRKYLYLKGNANINETSPVWTINETGADQFEIRFSFSLRRVQVFIKRPKLNSDPNKEAKPVQSNNSPDGK